eukprot:m.137314 g.137314  ORF g.137314 m.137314 type:complete len:50 (-) comp11535_c0_seq1:8-157(-)
MDIMQLDFMDSSREFIGRQRTATLTLLMMGNRMGKKKSDKPTGVPGLLT